MHVEHQHGHVVVPAGCQCGIDEPACGLLGVSLGRQPCDRVVGDLALDLAGGVIRETLSDDAKAKGVVDRFLADLEKAK